MNIRWSMILLLLLAPAAMAWDESKARIVTMIDKPAECMASVAVNQIDGKNTFVSAQGFELDPGRHTLNGRAKIDTRLCSVVRGNQNTAVPPLEADFEAGKTYFVGMDYSSSNREEWALVVWKVE